MPSDQEQRSRASSAEAAAAMDWHSVNRYRTNRRRRQTWHMEVLLARSSVRQAIRRANTRNTCISPSWLGHSDIRLTDRNAGATDLPNYEPSTLSCRSGRPASRELLLAICYTEASGLHRTSSILNCSL